ncbi:hypothetical protein [Cupriavidus necator]
MKTVDLQVRRLESRHSARELQFPTWNLKMPKDTNSSVKGMGSSKPKTQPSKAKDVIFNILDKDHNSVLVEFKGQALRRYYKIENQNEYNLFSRAPLQVSLSLADFKDWAKETPNIQKNMEGSTDRVPPPQKPSRR